MLSSVGLVLSDKKILISDKKGCIIYGNIPFADFDKVRGKNDIIVRGFIEYGAVSDIRCAARALMPVLSKVTGPSFLKPDVAVAVPSALSVTSRHAFCDALKLSGAHRVMLVPSAMASAVGLGVDISRKTTIIITVDDRVSCFSIINSSCEAVGTASHIGYGDFDDALIRYLKKNRKIVIGRMIAENIRKNNDETRLWQGRDLAEGRCVEFSIGKDELSDIYNPVITRFCEIFCDFSDSLTPSLLTSAEAVIITGSEPLVPGIEDAVSNASNLTTQISGDCECIARGIGLISNRKLRKELGLTYLYEGIT